MTGEPVFEERVLALVPWVMAFLFVTFFSWTERPATSPLSYK